MIPSLSPGDEIGVDYFSKPRALSEIPEGKVVLLKDQSEWVAHRVVSWNGENYAKGDWGYALDPMSEAWGEVIRVNGKRSSILFHPWIAQQSAKNTKEVRRARRIFRKLLIWSVAMFLKKKP